MTLVKRLRSHVIELCEDHRLHPKMVRTMIGLDLLPKLGGPTSASHKCTDETIREYAPRMMLDRLPLTDLDQCPLIRERLVAIRAVGTVDVPDDVVRACARLMHENGIRANVYSVHGLIGGSMQSLGQSIARVRPEFDDQQWLIARATMGIAEHALIVLVRNGFVPELLHGSPVHGQLIDFATLGTRIREAFLQWKPDVFALEQVKDVAVIRSALRLGAMAPHSIGIIDGAVSFLQKHEQPVTGEELHTLLAGDIKQFVDYLTDRARSVGDVRLPKRQPGRKDWTTDDLRHVLPSPINELHDTALDPLRGSTRDKFTGADIMRIVANPHTQLQIIGAVVTLHGARTKAMRAAAMTGGRAAANLATSLDGIDVTNGAQLAAGLTAIRMASKASKDRYDIHRTARDVYRWRDIQRVFDDYMSRNDLPASTREFLTPFRPAFPGDSVFTAALQVITDFAQDSKSERDTTLQPFLVDIPGFLRQVAEAQGDLEALRDHVKAQVSEEEMRLGVDVLSRSLEGYFDTTARMPDGSIADVRYHYSVHPWTGIVAKINDATPVRQDRVLKKPFGHSKGETHLFENKYVLEPTTCTRDGVVIDYPLAIFRLHRDYGFWGPRTCPDEAAYAVKCKRMAEFGISTVTIRHTGESIAWFPRSQSGHVRRARVLFGTFLFPLEQAYHSSLIGALQIESRAVNALRVGDHMQWNVGSGLETGYDDDENPFSVFLSTPKKKNVELKTPLNSRCEILTEKLMDLASERFFKGGPIPHLPRSAYNGKGPERESLVFCSRTQGLDVTSMANHCRLLLIGYSGFTTQYMKYIWSKLSRMQGSTIEERRAEHGHTTEGMTAEYDVRTPDEDEIQLKNRKEQAELRGQWLHGERETALPDPPAKTLQFARMRLLHDIEFLKEEGAGVELDKARAELRLVEAKLTRAQSRS